MQPLYRKNLQFYREARPALREAAPHGSQAVGPPQKSFLKNLSTFCMNPSKVLPQTSQRFSESFGKDIKKTGKGISSFPRPHPLHMVQFFNNDSISSSSVRKPLSTSKRFFTILQACNTVAWSFLPTTIPILLVEESVYFFERYMAICRT